MNERIILDALRCDRRGCCSRHMAHCPVSSHNDSSPSLSVRERHGKVLVHCFGGCTQEAVIDALKALGLWGDDAAPLSLPPLQPRAERRQEARKRADHWRVDVAYQYRDEDSDLLFEVCRTGNGAHKRIRQRQPRAGGGWWADSEGVRRVLYRLPELLAADSSLPVFICSGEKDADRLAAAKLVATTNPGGEGPGKWLPDFTPFLAGRNCIVMEDNDDTGRAHCQEVAEALTGTAASIKILRLPELPEHGDVSDWLDAGGGLSELLRWAAVWQDWRPAVTAFDANLQRDLGEAQERLQKLQAYNDTLISERDTADRKARDATAELREERQFILTVGSSPDLEQTYKLPAILFHVASKVDPKWRKAYDEPTDCYYPDFTTLTGIKDDETIKKILLGLDAGNFLTLTSIPCAVKNKFKRDGTSVESFRYLIQLGAREGEAALTLAQRAELLAHPSDDRIRRKRYGTKGTTKPRCPDDPTHPIRALYTCTVSNAVIAEETYTPNVDSVRKFRTNDCHVAPVVQPKRTPLAAALTRAEIPQEDPLSLRAEDPDGVPFTLTVCDCGTPLHPGEACFRCELAACKECGKPVHNVFVRFCAVPCTPSRSRPYTTAPPEVAAEYAAGDG